MEQKCIYCGKNHDLSESDIIPDALTNARIFNNNVWRIEHNNRFSDMFESKVIEALAEIKVPGRSEMVPNKKEIPIMIDYAHSPESLQNILSAVKSYTRGRVISVFGCGGDRDKGKRPLMGEISGKIADFTFITTDNPRTEEPEEIVKEIEEGMKKTNGKYKVVVDRKEAIKEAIEMINAWLETEFKGGRYKERLDMLEKIENENMK